MSNPEIAAARAECDRLTGRLDTLKAERSNLDGVPWMSGNTFTAAGARGLRLDSEIANAENAAHAARERFERLSYGLSADPPAGLKVPVTPQKAHAPKFGADALTEEQIGLIRTWPKGSALDATYHEELARLDGSRVRQVAAELYDRTVDDMQAKVASSEQIPFTWVTLAAILSSVGEIAKQDRARARALTSLVETLATRVAELEARPTVGYCGVWRDRDDKGAPLSFKHGNLVTHDGSIFHAERDTSSKPGASEDWKLAVKRGRDGKDVAK